MHSSATCTVSAFGDCRAPTIPCFRTMTLHLFRSVSISGCVKQNCESASPASSRPNTAHAAWDIAKRFSGWTYLSAGAQRVGPLYRLAHRSEQPVPPCLRQVLVHIQRRVGGRTPAPLPSSVSWLRSRGGCGSSVRSSSQPPGCNCPRGAPALPMMRLINLRTALRSRSTIAVDQRMCQKLLSEKDENTQHSPLDRVAHRVNC